MSSLNALKLRICASFKYHTYFKKQNLTCLYKHKCFSTDNTKIWRIIFFGTDKFSEICLRALNSNRLASPEARTVKEIDVVCIEADSEVRRCAKSLGLKIFTWPFQVTPNVYDIGVVVSFGHMIPTDSILACKYGFINAHPSLLPRWRGAAPIVHTILYGDTETGVTITQVSPKKFDVGNIILQEKQSVPENCTSVLLSSQLSHVASIMVIKTLESLPLLIKSSYPQPTEGITYARKVKSESGHLDWNQSTTISIDRKFRAYKGIIDIFTFWGSLKVVLLEHVAPEEVLSAKISTLTPENASPGYCYFHKRRKLLYVKCQEGWTGITQLKIPKKGQVTAQDFYNGFISKVKPSDCYFTNQV